MCWSGSSCVFVRAIRATATGVYTCVRERKREREFVFQCEFVCVCVCFLCSSATSYVCVRVFLPFRFLPKVQPNSDRVAQNLAIISKTLYCSTRRTRILMGFMISTMLLLGTHRNSMGRILVRQQSFRNDLKILCHPICIWLCIHV